MTSLQKSDGDLILPALRLGVVHLWLYSLWDFRAAGEMPSSAWQPISVALGFTTMPSAGLFDALYAAATASALLLLFGVFTSISGPATVAFGTILASVGMSFGKLMHDSNGLLLTLFVLSFSSWGRRLSLDAWRSGRERPVVTTDEGVGLALWTCAFALALPYLSSGILKIWNGQFLSPENFPRLLASFTVRAGERSSVELAAVRWLLEHRDWAHALAFVGVGLEIGFCVGLLSRPLRILAWIGAIFLHLGNSALLGISFRQQTLLCVYLLVAEVVLTVRARDPAAHATTLVEGDVPSGAIAGIMAACFGLSYVMAALPAADGGAARKLLEPLHQMILVRPPGSLPFLIALTIVSIVGVWGAILLVRRRAGSGALG